MIVAEWLMIFTLDWLLFLSVDDVCLYLYFENGILVKKAKIKAKQIAFDDFEILIIF